MKALDVCLPVGALAAALLVFGGFVWLGGASPVETWTILFKGAFGDWFSWQNTLQRAAPLMLTALCVALPARAGLIIIGGEGAFVLGGLAAAALPYAFASPGNVIGTALLCVAGMIVGGAWIALAGALRQYRGVNETISSLLLAYTAIALFKQLVEGPLRDPKTLNKPSTRSLAESLQIGGIAGSDVHWGLVLGVVACLGLGLWLAFTPGGFALRVVGGNPRTAQLVGLPANRLILLACALGGGAAGLAGAVEVAAVHTNANASLIAGYGYAGILVAFIARQNPFAIIPVAILFGGFGAAGSLLQRRLGLPDASVQVLQGIAFVLILASESLRSVDWAAVSQKWRHRATPEPVEAARPAAAAREGVA
jgi:simple sugar transport system permease protein